METVLPLPRPRSPRAALAVFLVVILAAGALAAVARADGDPASDYLVANPVFLAAQTGTLSTPQRQLLAVVAAATRAGFPIRVATVGSEYDLGSITELWGKPRLYARFLGLELSSTYRGRLLVVMPGGFGFNWPGHAAGPSYRALSRLRPAAGGPGLAAGAGAAVQALAGAAGVSFRAPAASSARPAVKGGGGVTLLVVILAALAALALGAAARGRRRRRAGSAPAAVAALARPRGDRRRWLIPGFATLACVAFGVPVVVLLSTRHVSAAPGADSTSLLTRPPVSWAPGARPAPDFVLRDQAGRRVSLSAYRGRPVIVTFVDPLCRNLCPLEAHVLNAAVGELPAAQRPTILAVSVDVYANANARRNLLQDVHQWSLVPQWHWAVGRASALAAVWRRYRIGVSVTTRRVGRTKINYIIHSEAAYVIDRTGHERSLFLWPFYPQDVAHTLRGLS